MKNLVLCAALLWIAMPVRAQKKTTEGKITYTISYDQSNLPEEYASMVPTQMTMYFKGGKTRAELGGGMGMRITTIQDNVARTMVQLMDVMGRKLAVRYTEPEIVKESEKATKPLAIEKTGRTKEIAGYACKHARVKSDEGEYDLYYSPSLFVKGNNWSNDLKAIEGIPLQYRITEDDLTMSLTASEVALGPVDDALFSVPAEYQAMTPEELMKTFGHGQ